MSKTLGSLLVRLGMDPRDADRALKKFEKDIQRFSKNTERIGRQMSVGFTAPFLAGMAKSLQLFDRQAQAERRLQVAIGGVSEALLGQAAAIQKVTTFGDEQIIEQQAFAASLGLSEEKVQDLVQGAVNLSAALGISLESATKNLAKTTAGLTGELGELVPGLKGFTTEQLKAGDAIKYANEQFGGFAEAAALTGTGPLKQLTNQLGDAAETMGKAFLPIVIALKEKISALVTTFQSLSDEQKQSIVAWGAVIAAVGPMLLLLPRFIKLVTFLASPVGLATVAIAALAAGTIWLAKNWDNLIAQFGESRVKLVFNAITVQVQILHAALKGLISAVEWLIDNGEKALSFTPYGIAKSMLHKDDKPEYRGRADAAGLWRPLSERRGRADAAGLWHQQREPVEPVKFKGFGEIFGEIGQDLFSMIGRDKGLAAIREAQEKIDQIVSDLNRGIQPGTVGAFLSDDEKEKLRVEMEKGSRAIIGDVTLPDLGETRFSKVAKQLLDAEQQWQDAIEGFQNSKELGGLIPGIEELPDAFDRIKGKIADIQPVLAETKEGIYAFFGQSKEQVDAWLHSVSKIGDIFVGAFDAIMQGGKAFGKFMQQLFMDIVKQAIKAVVVTSLLTLLSGGTAKFGAIFKEISGLGRFLGGFKSFASGGLAFGPQLAMVGDNPNARFDPEIISPLSKLRQHLGGGQLSGQVVFKIRGSDLIGALKHANRDVKLSGGFTL